MVEIPYDHYEELREDMRTAIYLIEGLAQQQAMEDDWYVEKLNELKEKYVS